MCQQLELLGHQVDAAEDGTEALDIWTRAGSLYDLLITDCDMPKMDGFSLVRNLRTLELQQSLKPMVIFGLTANAQQKVIGQCLEAGMSDCLFKPLSIDALAERINRFAPLKTEPTESKHALALASHHAPINLKAFLTEVIHSNNLDAQQLELAMNQGDLQGLVSLAHRIKGAASYVDGHDLVAACEKLQELINQNQQKLIHGHAQEMLHQIGILESVLMKKLSECGPESTSTGSSPSTTDNESHPTPSPR
jgi:two-component system sensor histidine kinase EvgS